jgi:hypothetical protein
MRRERERGLGCVFSASKGIKYSVFGELVIGALSAGIDANFGKLLKGKVRGAKGTVKKAQDECQI